MIRSCFLLAILLLKVATARCQSITWSKENVPLDRALRIIKKQAGYEVFFESEAVNKASRVSVSVENASVPDFLKTILKDRPFTFRIVDKSVFIDASVDSPKIPPPANIVIKGVIRDSTGNPVSGATVSPRGPGKSVIAKGTGEFSITVPRETKELEITAVNYENAFVTFKAPAFLKVIMQSRQVVAENDVVVVGYGTSKKRDLTGSISTVSAADIGDRAASTLAPLIQGRIPGMDISGSTIRIRGVNSFNFTDPLVVIDGFLGGTIDNINPNDIENVEVLKDASSTAIYGARGANGVVLVSTKSGKPGPVKVNINTFTGLETTTKKLDVLNSADYIDFVKDAMTNAGQPMPLKLQSPSVRVTRTNWQNEVFKTGKIREFNMDFSGGVEKTTYFFSAGYRHEEGITIGPSSDDIYLRNKNEFKVRSWFRGGNNLALSYKISRGEAPWDVKSVVNMPPYFEVKDPANYWGYSSSNRNTDLGNNRNPVALSALTHPETTSLGYTANMWLELEPISNLVYRVQAGINGYVDQTKVWNDQYNDDAGSPIPNNYSENSANGFFPVIESYITYKKKLRRHKFSLMAGNSWQDGAKASSLGVMGQDYALTEVRNIFNARTRSITSMKYYKYAFLSYFGRINYQYNDTYLLTVNMRRDGSPRFAPNHRWGTFPSVAVAWKLHKLPAIENLKIFDELKLRLSVGSAGNDGIGEFKYVSPVWTNGVYYPFGTVPALNAGATVIQNSTMDIRWESTISKTIGLDLAFMRNALQLTTEYFFKTSKDILFTVPRPASLGYGIAPYGGDAVVNAASCNNNGIELAAKYRGSAGKFKYSVNANFTSSSNRVTSLGLGQPYLSGVNRTATGFPIGYFYGYVADGVFMKQSDVDAANEAARKMAATNNPSQASNEVYYQESSTRAGDMRFKDINGDGRVTASDQTMIGNSIPTKQYGLFGSLKYENFDLELYFQGTGGYQIFYRGFEDTRGMKAVQNQESYVLDRWRSENEPGNGQVPRAVIGDPSQNLRPSTRMISNGDYFKLRQASLGYSLSQNLMRRLQLSACRFYLTGANLFTITQYTEFDPEYSGPNLTRGTDWLNFPINPRTIILGVKVTL